MQNLSKERAILCAKIAASKKAEDIIVLEVSPLTYLTDYLVICSGTSDIQVRAIADEIYKELKKEVKIHHIEGYEEGNWILLDYEDVIVHIFYESTRKFYQLEELWGDAATISWEDSK